MPCACRAPIVFLDGHPNRRPVLGGRAEILVATSVVSDLDTLHRMFRRSSAGHPLVIAPGTPASGGVP